MGKRLKALELNFEEEDMNILREIDGCSLICPDMQHDYKKGLNAANNFIEIGRAHV